MPRKKRARVSGDEEEADAPPTKRRRQDSDEKDLEDDATMDDDGEEKMPEITSLNDVQTVLDFDVGELSSKAQVTQKFRDIATTLMRDTVMAVTPLEGSTTKLYRLVEVEFYFLDGRLHPDVYAHCDKLQLETSGSWYFHRGGNNSMEGYQLLTRRAGTESDLEDSFRDEDDLLSAIAAEKSYRGASYKGLDITFGRPGVAFGGMLIRAIEEYNPVHSAFTAGKQYSPGDMVEGPSKTVDTILAAANAQSISSLETANGWTLDCFDQNNSVLHLKWAHDYPCATERVSRGDIDFHAKPCHSSPRVGLTFKPPTGIHGVLLEKVNGIKQDFIVAPYRYIRTSRLSQMKKMRPWVFLSLLTEYAGLRGGEVEDVMQPVTSFLSLKPAQAKKYMEPYNAGKASGYDEVARKYAGKGKFAAADLCTLFGGLFPGF